MEKAIIGIDIGGTQIKSAVVQNGVLYYESICDTPLQDGLKKTLADCVQNLTEKAQKDGVEIGAIGIGSPGVIDEQGIILFSNNLPMKNFDLCSDLRKRFMLPVTILNDALCAALAEHRLGAGQGARDMAMITIGTGLGCVLIINNVLYTGRNGTATCGGHMVIDRFGVPCNCSHRGCWERYASTSGLLAEAEHQRNQHADSLLHASKTLNGKMIFEAEKAGDKAAKLALEQFFSSLADGLIGIVNMLRPEKIVIGGGVSAQGTAFTERAMALVKNKTYAAFEMAPYEIVPAKFRNTAGILGASLYAAEQTQNKN